MTAPPMGEFTDDELRYLRKNLSMGQAQLESRARRTQGDEHRRCVRDMVVGATAYNKVQQAITERLIGDDE